MSNMFHIFMMHIYKGSSAVLYSTTGPEKNLLLIKNHFFIV